MLFPLFLETDPKLDKQDIIFHFLKDISKACLNHTYFVILILRNSLCCELYLFDLNEKHLFKYYRLLKIKLLYCCTYFMHIETKILDNFCISLLRRMYFPDTIEINHLNVFILVFNHFMHFSIYIENFIEFISWETMCRICIRTHLRRKQCNELCRHLNLNYINR